MMQIRGIAIVLEISYKTYVVGSLGLAQILRPRYIKDLSYSLTASKMVNFLIFKLSNCPSGHGSNCLKLSKMSKLS